MLRRPGLVCAALLALASAPSHATIANFDTTSRTAVGNAYTNTYVPLFSVPSGWNGNVATCNEGTTTLEHQQATIDAANFYRVMVGLPQVNLITDSTDSRVLIRARKAALVTAANFPPMPPDPHHPAPGATCYTAEGYVGAGASNLSMGTGALSGYVTGPGGIAGYIDDQGNGGELGGQLGHRRWVLFSRAKGFATSDIVNPGGTSANALRVMANQSNSDGLGIEPESLFWGTAPAAKLIAWPSPNFVPYEMLPSTRYWSVSYPGANFAGASVAMTTANGTTVPVQVYPLGPFGQYFLGDNTLQFMPTLPSAPGGGMNDTSYKVSVSGVTGAGVPSTFCYTVTVFDPQETGPEAAPNLCTGAKLAQTITFANNPSPVTVGDTYTPSASASSGLTPVTFTASGNCTIASGVVTFNGFAGSGTGTCTVTAEQLGNGTYDPVTKPQDIMVYKKTQTIAFDPATPTEMASGTSADVAATATSGLILVEFGTTSQSAVCTVTSAGHVNAIGSGTCVITANQSGDNTYYAAPQQEWSIAIDLLPQTITFDPPATASAGTTLTLSASGGDSGNSVIFSVPSASSAVCSVSGDTLTFSGAGNCVVNANQAGDSTHAAAPQVQKTIAVSKQSQTITFDAQNPASHTFAPMPNNTFPLNPVATTDATGLSVSYTSLTHDKCSINGITVTIIEAGTCTIAADQSGSTIYEPAEQKTQSITINRATQSITFTSENPVNVAEGDTYTVTATADSGLPVTFAVSGSCSINGSVVTFNGTGACEITASQAGNTNYEAAGDEIQDIAVQSRQNLSITSTPPQPPIAPGTTYTVEVSLTGTAGPTGMLTLSIDPSSTSGACTISGNVVTFHASTGTCIVVATAEGTGVYAPASVQQIITLDEELPEAIGIPTLGQWALVLLAALTALAGLPAFRRRAAAAR